MTKKSPYYKARVTTTDNAPWPFAGNVYVNRDGSLNLVLDVGVSITLKDGTVLESKPGKGNKVTLHLSRPRGAELDEIDDQVVGDTAAA